MSRTPKKIKEGDFIAPQINDAEVKQPESKCRGKRCKYREQFPNAMADECNVVIAPMEFIHIEHFNLFDKIYFDESIKLQHTDYDFNAADVYLNLKKIPESKYAEEGLLSDDIYSAVVELDIDYLTQHMETIDKIIKKRNRHIARFGFKKIVGGYCNIDIEELIMVLDFYKRSHGLKQDGCVTEFIQRISYQDLVFYKHMQSGVDVVYKTATLTNLFFKQLDKFRELYPEYHLKIKIKSTTYFNPHCYTYLATDYGFYKRNFTEYIKNHGSEIRKLIRNLMYEQKKKVCVLTFKKAIKNGKFYGADAFHFFGVEGINKFKNYDVIIVIGTVLYPERNLKKLFKEYYPGEKMPDIELVDDGLFKKYTDRRLQLIHEDLQTQLYNWISRIRPLKLHNKNKACEIMFIAKNPPKQLFKDTIIFPNRITF